MNLGRFTPQPRDNCDGSFSAILLWSVFLSYHGSRSNSIAFLCVITRIGSDQSIAAGDVGGLGAVFCLQLSEDVGHMVLDGALGQDQPIGDLAVGVSLNQKDQYLSFAPCERLNGYGLGGDQFA